MIARLVACVLLVVALHARAESAGASYSLRYDAGAETMAVRICVPHAAKSLHFSADDGAERYVESLARDGAPAPVRDADGWSASEWRAGECVSYRAALGKLADSGRRGDGARHGGTIVFDPAVWLLRVDDDSADADEARVELPSGFMISAPWHAESRDGDALLFTIPRTPDNWLARIAIGRFAEAPLALAGGTLRVSIVDGAEAAAKARLDAWLARVTGAALSAYGKLPLADVQVLIVPVGASREPVEFGQSTRGQGHGVTLFVDAAQPESAFDRDWVAVHEMSHLFHPYLGDRGSWLAEGLATYYQNVLRARAGLLTPADAWEQIDAGFARGRSATSANDDTLERAAAGVEGHSNFMRIYWSGTAYWLEADLELRRASGNALSVDEALKRFDACCLPDYRGWRPEAFVAKLDALVGGDVFRRTFDTFRARRDFPDLKRVYRALGISRAGETLAFDDAAPDASIRRAITSAAHRSGDH
jgi:hypothetical protein